MCIVCAVNVPVCYREPQELQIVLRTEGAKVHRKELQIVLQRRHQFIVHRTYKFTRPITKSSELHWTTETGQCTLIVVSCQDIMMVVGSAASCS